jgi:hypothetical protein
LISIILGFVVERNFVDWLKRITNWPTLIFVLVLSIFMNSTIVYCLHSSAVNYEAPEIADGEWQQTLKDIKLLWQNRDSGLKIVPEQVMTFNTRMTQLMYNNQGWRTICRRRSTKMPSNFEFDLRNYSKFSPAHTCHETVSRFI